MHSVRHPVEVVDPCGLTPQTRAVKAAVSPERWSTIVAAAEYRVRLLDAVTAEWERTGFRRRALETVAPEVHWSNYLNWCRCADVRAGEPWERQLDARVPPEAKGVPAEIRASACALRRAVPGMSCETARTHLIAQFGEDKGGFSAATLKRIWKDAGLSQPRGRQPGARVDTVILSGGAALGFLSAAAAETGVIDEIGRAVVARVKEVARQAQETAARIEDMAESVLDHLDEAATAHPGAEWQVESVRPAPLAAADEVRDEKGRFTGAYNRAARGTRPRDPRRDSDATKRKYRRLGDMSLAEASEAVVGQKFLAIGVAPLLTERRGFDGLNGPSGAWLAALGGHAYQPATLDKALAEFAAADVGEAMWSAHGKQWAEITQPWRESEDAPFWLRFVTYVDATQDPYWTHEYAASGKVSRVNNVMPCLTRVAMTGGPGVPLAVETHAGAVSLKTELVPFLDRMKAVLGDGELGRLTVVDAEMGTIPLMTELVARPGHWFITVLKGGTAKAARKDEEGAWERYRDRDLIRDVRVRLGATSDGESALTLRGIEMVREGSRNPTTTTFVTSAPPDALPSGDVADAYLSRWPHQEQKFRNGRNGLGMNRSHGYGGDVVTHVAFTTTVEKATAAVEHAAKKVARTEAAETAVQDLLAGARATQRAAAKAAAKSAKRESEAARRRHAEAVAELQRQSTKPREIYVRDTTRDGIVTCAKLTVMMLMEYTLKEYFGGLRMEARTFIESLVNLPVTIRRTKTETLHEIHENPRNPVMMTRLRAACAEVNRRKISVDGRTLQFRVVPQRMV